MDMLLLSLVFFLISLSMVEANSAVVVSVVLAGETSCRLDDPNGGFGLWTLQVCEGTKASARSVDAVTSKAINAVNLIMLVVVALLALVKAIQLWNVVGNKNNSAGSYIPGPSSDTCLSG
jgi:hypothetical protein